MVKHLVVLCIGLLTSCLYNQGWSQELPATPEHAACTRLFPDVKDAYEVRLKMIASAKHEVLMSYYHFANSAKPFFLLALLENLCNKGVKVRVLLDDMNAEINTPALAYLDKVGIEVRMYNPVILRRIFRIDRRMHDKFLIIDRKYVLVGGRNISKKYFEGNLEVKHTFYDLDAFFEGKPAAQAADYFDKRWDSKWVEPAVVKEKKLDRTIYDDIQVKTLEQMSLIRADTVQKSLAHFLKSPCKDATFVSNDPYKIARNRPVEKAYIERINQAQKEIKIQNAYILFTRHMRRAIKGALARNVQVEMVGNSLQSIDIPISYAAYLNIRNRYLKKGVKFYEFLHAQTMHTKLAIIDNTAIVGSFNLDPRSAFRNSETVVIVTDEPAVQEVRDYFTTSKKLSTPIGLDKKPEGYSQRYPHVPFQRKWSAAMLRYTIVPIIRSFL